VIGVAADGHKMMVAYIILQKRQCGEIGHSTWNTHIETLKKAEQVSRESESVRDSLREIVQDREFEREFESVCESL
jgi:hypothetical protein